MVSFFWDHLEEAMNSSGIPSFSDKKPTTFPSSSGIFDLLPGDLAAPGKASIGFVELMGLEDLSPSIFEYLLPPLSLPPTPVPESSDAGNPPATPNSSSMSSMSTEAANEEQAKEAEEEEVVEEEQEEEQERINKL